MDKDTVVTLLKYKRWIDLATLQAIRHKADEPYPCR